jgi:acyl carrier protein
MGAPDNPQDREKPVAEMIEPISSERMIDQFRLAPDATIESLDLKTVDITMILVILTALEETFNGCMPMDVDLQEARDVKAPINGLADLIIKKQEED